MEGRRFMNQVCKPQLRTVCIVETTNKLVNTWVTSGAFVLCHMGKITFARLRSSLLIQYSGCCIPEGLYHSLFRWLVSGFILTQDWEVVPSLCFYVITCTEFTHLILLTWERLYLMSFPTPQIWSWGSCCYLDSDSKNLKLQSVSLGHYFRWESFKSSSNP